MKERILTGWTIARWLYLGIGILMIVQSVISRQWFGIAIGSYFAAMGLFAFGCAAGNCINTADPKQPQRPLHTDNK